jgi:hypothetical protein
MNWVEPLLILSLVLGVFAGGILIARSPTFWIGIGSVMFRAALPFLFKRMTLKEEEAWRKCQLTGGKWNHRKRRCE